MRTVLVVLLVGCQMKAGAAASSSTMPMTSSSASSSSSSEGPSALETGEVVFMPGIENMSRKEAEQLLRDKGFTGQILATGDTTGDPLHNESVCGQTPEAVQKVAKNVTITLKYCAHIYKSQEVTPLTGLTIEQAKAKARAKGFTGEIEVMELSATAPGCQNDTVCQVTPDRWELNQEHRMQLWINKKVTIKLPD